MIKLISNIHDIHIAFFDKIWYSKIEKNIGLFGCVSLGQCSHCFKSQPGVKEKRR